MSGDLRAQQETLRQLTRTDPDPRVRRRAHALLLLSEGHSVVRGRPPVRDRSAPGAGVALALPGQWPARSWPTSRGLVVPRSWMPRPWRSWRGGAGSQSPDLRAAGHDLEHPRPARRARPPSGHAGLPTTVHRAVQRLGYRYRRPRHDLPHRQDQEAVAAATEVLTWLRKKALTPPATCAWSTSTSARSTVIPAWQKCGNGEGVR